MTSEEKKNVWQAHIEKQENSGLSIREYCERENIGTVSFYAWRRRMGFGSRGKRIFLPVVLKRDGTSQGSGIEVEIRDEVRIKIEPNFHEAVLEKVLGILKVIS